MLFIIIIIVSVTFCLFFGYTICCYFYNKFIKKENIQSNNNK